MKAELHTADGCVGTREVADDYIRRGARLVTPLIVECRLFKEFEPLAPFPTREYRFVGYSDHPINGRTAVFKEIVP